MSESTQLVYPPLKEQKKQNIETFIEQKSKSMICPELTFDETQDQIKQELLNKLLEINKNLNKADPQQAFNLAVGLFKIIVDDQSKIKNRQKIINNCLKNYDNILKNYNDQSIKISKLEEIVKTLSQIRTIGYTSP